MSEYIRQFDPETQRDAERDLLTQISIANDVSLNLLGFGKVFKKRNPGARLNQLSVRFRQHEDEYEGAKQVVVWANLVGTQAAPASLHFDYVTVALSPKDGEYKPESDDFNFEQFVGAISMADGLLEDRDKGLLTFLSDDLSHLEQL